jgi:transketolase
VSIYLSIFRIMSLVREDLANYLKQEQMKLEKRLQQIKQKTTQYESGIANYLAVENRPLQINGTYKISLQQSSPQEPLTFKYLDKCFREVIPNDTQREQLMRYIKENRTRVYKQKVVFDLLTIKDGKSGEK